ncbi:MAG: hypothetical protein QW705_01095 [Zestosphaera sp.]
MSIWNVRKDEERSWGVVHVVVFVFLSALGALSATLSSFLQVSYGISWFYLAVVIQILGGVWFGLWGVLAGVFFPIVGDLTGGIPISISISLLPANLVQSLIPALAFRLLKADPRLRSSRDWITFIMSCVIFNNVLGAYLGTTAMLSWGFITGEIYYGVMASWFLGNVLPAVSVGVPVLKGLSPMVVNHRAFCKGWLT